MIGWVYSQPSTEIWIKHGLLCVHLLHYNMAVASLAANRSGATLLFGFSMLGCLYIGCLTLILIYQVCSVREDLLDIYKCAVAILAVCTYGTSLLYGCSKLGCVHILGYTAIWLCDDVGDFTMKVYPN